MRSVGCAVALGILFLTSTARAQGYDGAPRRRTAKPTKAAPARAASSQRGTSRSSQPPDGGYAPAPQQEPPTYAPPPVAETARYGAAPQQDAPAYASSYRQPAQVEPSRYGEPDRAPSSGQHEGTYLRLDGGFGYMSVALPLGDQAGYTGIASLGALHAGLTVQEKTLLGLQLWAAALQNPKYKSSAGSTRAAGVTLSALGVGPELTVYFPANFYVSSAAGLTWLLMKNSAGAGFSQAGLGARVAIGTEWWLSARWGLGVAGVLAFSSNKFNVPEFGGTLPFQAWNAGVACSATYN